MEIQGDLKLISSTTIVAVKMEEKVAIAGDGQVTITGNIVMKNRAKKVRTLYAGKVIAGFAGSVADSFTLFEMFEKQLESYSGNLRRAAVELAKEWRTDRFLRRLDAMLVVASGDALLVLSGSGEVIEPDDGVTAIGSGGGYALAAARALVRKTELSPAEICRIALEIAAEICVFTNSDITIEEIQ